MEEVELGDDAVERGGVFEEWGIEASCHTLCLHQPSHTCAAPHACHSLALCVQDGARLNVRIRVVSPEEVQAALAALRERHGATGYDGRGPPTETSVGLREKDFVTLPEDLLELLVTLQPQKLSFWSCGGLVALPEGRLPSLCRPLPLWCPTAPGLLLPLPLPPPFFFC